jgi:endonuclease/exonuclease/phosphatase family metal-dependent hydrolase
MAAQGVQFMKLIQLNIWQGRLLRQALAYLEQEKPDLICLQEVYSSQIDLPGYEFLCSFEKIQAVLPDFHNFFSPCYEMSILDRTFEFGNALFSRYPLSDKKTFFICQNYQSFTSFDNYSSNIRNLQLATIDLPEKKFWIANHHAYWEINPMGSDTSVHSMEKVAGHLKTFSRPLVFAGDLNVISESPAMRPIQDQLLDLTQQYALPTTLSEFGKVANVACDHICISEGIAVQSFKSGKTLVSDHLPLILEFDLA